MMLSRRRLTLETLLAAIPSCARDEIVEATYTIARVRPAVDDQHWTMEVLASPEKKLQRHTTYQKESVRLKVTNDPPEYVKAQPGIEPTEISLLPIVLTEPLGNRGFVQGSVSVEIKGR